MNEFLIKKMIFPNCFTENVYGSNPYSPKPKKLISLSIYFLVEQWIPPTPTSIDISTSYYRSYYRFILLQIIYLIIDLVLPPISMPIIRGNTNQEYLEIFSMFQINRILFFQFLFAGVLKNIPNFFVLSYFVSNEENYFLFIQQLLLRIDA